MTDIPYSCPSFDAALHEVKEYHKTLIRILGDMESDAGNMVDEIEAQIKDARRINADLREELEAIESTVEEQQVEILTLKEEIDNLQDALKDPK